MPRIYRWPHLFWGSNIAFGKLQAIIPSRPVQFPGQHIFNGLLLAAILAGCIVLGIDHDSPSQGLYIGILIGAAVLGNLFVLPIGGADMPVVISLLNAFTGLAAAAAGFALDNAGAISLLMGIWSCTLSCTDTRDVL